MTDQDSATKDLPALVVLSGGQDSTTCLFWAKSRFKSVSAVTIDYGQRHWRELEAAKAVVRRAGALSHWQIKLGPILEGKSPLTNPDSPLEQYGSAEDMAKIIGDRVEKTFVPMRNALFLTLAANIAAVHGYRYIITGVCQEDNANYPDCTAKFILKMNDMIQQSLGQKYSDENAIWLTAPLMDLSKADTVRLAYELGAEAWGALAYTHTAYDGEYPPVGLDHASLLRAQGFLEARLPDPLVLRAWREGEMSLPDSSNYDMADSEVRLAALKAGYRV